MFVADYFLSDRYKTNICVMASVHQQGNWVEPAHFSFFRAHIDMYRYLKSRNCKQLGSNAHSSTATDSDYRFQKGLGYDPSKIINDINVTLALISQLFASSSNIIQ